MLLSSHILAEVEAICQRVSIVRHGRTVEAGSLSELRRRTLTVVRATTRRPANGLQTLSGVSDLKVDGPDTTFGVQAAGLDAALRHLADLEIQAITVSPPTLEDLFLRHYDDEASNTAKGRA